MASTTVGLATIAALVGVATTASASPSARLVYSRAPGAESCPDEAALHRAVVERVGYDPFFPWAKITVILRVQPMVGEAGFAATVDLVDEEGMAHGARELKSTGNSCVPLLEAAALAISIAIDPQSLVAPAKPAPVAPSHVTEPDPDPVGPSRAPAPAPVPTADVAPKTVELTSPALAVTLGPNTSIGVAPALAFGGALGLDVRWRTLSIGVEGGARIAPSVSAPGGGSIRSWLGTGTLAPCAHIGPLFGCPLLEVGSMRASSVDIATPRSDSSLWLGAGGRLGAQFAMSSRLFARVHVDVLANLHRATLRLNDLDAWTAPPASGVLGLDVAVRFL